MPELPEVETVVRGLRSALEGRSVESVEVLDDRWCHPLTAAALEAAITGRRIKQLSRRGKYILMETENETVLVMHLRMTGTLLLNPVALEKHARVVFVLDDESTLVFNDPRRFGTGLLLRSDQLDSYFESRLGLEPIDPRFTSEHLFETTRGRSAPLKSFLLDQRRMAGVGNIYADEALFRAGLHPLRKPRGLTREQVSLLRIGLIAALQAGIDAGGATIDDFRNPDGAWGAYQSEFLVHRREGLPCPECGRPITRFVVGGRATYCCESCQKRPAGV